LEEKANFHCKELMDKYFPEVKGYSNPVQNATKPGRVCNVFLLPTKLTGKKVKPQNTLPKINLKPQVV